MLYSCDSELFSGYVRTVLSYHVSVLCNSISASLLTFRDRKHYKYVKAYAKSKFPGAMAVMIK
jgi:hypothetical protein